jgi:RNA polymerase sigma-70 factor, ECF subfamily
MTEQVNALLDALSAGDALAMEQLMPVVYDELRFIAHRQLRRERPGHTLNTTALVHEAYLKLVRLDRVTWQSRAHFLAIAATMMRNILVNYAVERRAQKRGGGEPPITLDDSAAAGQQRSEDLLALDEALQRLAQLNSRHAKMVEYRFFGGLSIEETAEVLGVSPATVKRDWLLCRAWLNRELGSGGSGTL